MLQLLLFLLGTDGNVKGPGTAAPVKGPDDNDNGDAQHDHVDDDAAPMLRLVSTAIKQGWKGASSQDDDGDDSHERELHREPGYAPTLLRPTAAAAAASACASSELPPALRSRLNRMCATESGLENRACGRPVRPDRLDWSRLALAQGSPVA